MPGWGGWGLAGGQDRRSLSLQVRRRHPRHGRAGNRYGGPGPALPRVGNGARCVHSHLQLGWGGGCHADAASLLSPDITVICPWEAFSHLELHELAQYGII